MPDAEPTPIDRLIGVLLSGILGILGISGAVILYGEWSPWLYDLHRFAGFSLIVLIPFKVAALLRDQRQGGVKAVRRSLSLLSSWVLAVLICLVILLGLFWALRLGPYSTLHQSLLTWHWILGTFSMPLVALYAWKHWPRPQPQSGNFLSRRSALGLLGLAGAGILLGRLANLLAEAQATDESPRRFTGSRGFGTYSGNDFPITGESTLNVDIEAWRLAVTGAVGSPLSLTYKDLLDMPQQVLDKAIDCHNGWYSLQEWGGVPLADLLEKAGLKEKATGVRLVSLTGLTNTHTLQEARETLLSTHVTGEVLDPTHGFPLRAVIPGRRGWFWMKWLAQIEVLEDPLEVIGGIVCAPGQVFRELDDPRVSTDVR